MKRRLFRWLVLGPLLVFLWALLDHPRPRAAHQAEWLDAGGVLVRSVRAGSGDTTLLFLHGYGESLTTWRAVFDPLAARAKVVAIDLPGFGGSAKPDVSYSLPAMTERLSRFLDGSTTGPIVLVGHSMGGQLAAALAIARPDRVKLLVLIAPAGFRLGLAGIAGSMTPGKARTIGRYLALRSFITPIHDPAWLGEPDSAADYDLTGDAKYSRAASRVLEEFDFLALRNRFGEITQPTLLIWGGLDPVVPYSVGDTLSHTIPCVQFVPLPNAFHRPHVEVPDTVISVVRSFLEQPGCLKPLPVLGGRPSQRAGS